MFHNNRQLIVKTKCDSLEKSIATTFGQHFLQNLNQVSGHGFTAWVPKKELCGEKTIDRKTFVFVNERPVVDKKIEKLLRDSVKPCLQPHVVIVNVEANDLDVNLDPNKYSVFFANQAELLQNMEAVLKEYYSDAIEEATEVSDTPKDSLCCDTKQVDNTTQQVEKKVRKEQFLRQNLGEHRI